MAISFKIFHQNILKLYVSWWNETKWSRINFFLQNSGSFHLFLALCLNRSLESNWLFFSLYQSRMGFNRLFKQTFCIISKILLKSMDYIKAKTATLTKMKSLKIQPGIFLMLGPFRLHLFLRNQFYDDPSLQSTAQFFPLRVVACSSSCRLNAFRSKFLANDQNWMIGNLCIFWDRNEHNQD